MRQNYAALTISIICALISLTVMMLSNYKFIDIGKPMLSNYDIFGILMIFSYLWARVEIGLYKIRKGKIND